MTICRKGIIWLPWTGVGGGGLVHKDEGEGAGCQVEEWFRWLHPISSYVGSGRTIFH